MIKNSKTDQLIVVTGPTATGKTQFAAQLAYRVGGEIISADSRQVYRGMNLATGKDIDDYIVDGQQVPYHLVDIVDPGYEYNVFEFQQDFIQTYREILKRKRRVVLCGGTGMYIESVLKGYRMVPVPEDEALRASLADSSMTRLIELLKQYKLPHNVTDTDDRDRLVRAIEIQKYEAENPQLFNDFPDISPILFGIHFERQVIRERITERLTKRLDMGMVDEVKVLLEKGLTPEQLKFYGLEYRYLTQFAIGEITFDEMFRLLNTAIHQFAKRQMTWFRKMERKGFNIHWIDGSLDMDGKLECAANILRSKDIIMD